MTKPTASLSLDLDNLWSYMKTHGDAGWESFPSYLDTLVPIVLDLLESRGWKITFFVVGQDAAIESNHPALRALADAGHEIANHSFHHEPWLHLYTPDQLDAELARTEDAIEHATGVLPTGFRGPGFSCSIELLRALKQRGYKFDASTLPTWVGPLARKYYFMRARDMTAEEREQRAALFGTMRDAFRPVHAYQWRLDEGDLLEIPVTTLPLARVPFHLSYILFLSTFCPPLARSFFIWGLRLCRLRGVEPSILLHPLDFLGGDDCTELAFFPAMQMGGATKRARAMQYLDDLAQRFDIVPMGKHADRLIARGGLRIRTADLVEGASSAM